MNKEQLLTIIQGGHLTDGDLADALLAKLAKQSEPVAMYCGYSHSTGHVFRADAVIDVGTYLYTQPLPQPDLAAEIERLSRINSDLCRVHNQHVVGSARFEEQISELHQQLNEQDIEIETLRANSKGLFTECGKLRVRADELDNQCIELRQQLSAAQSRIELLEHDAKTGDYETLYAQTVVELSAAQASEAELLSALKRCTKAYSPSHVGQIVDEVISNHKARKEGK